MGKLEKPVIIGIAGGSGSVKTTIAHEIADNIDDQDRIMIMTQDSLLQRQYWRINGRKNEDQLRSS